MNSVRTRCWRVAAFPAVAMKAAQKLVMACVFSMLAALPASATTSVLLDFDGDGAFPSLTFGAPTTGLAAFTGSAFAAGGLSAADLAAVKGLIMTGLAADYAPYDIQFVTDTTGLASWYTWGIDDTAFVGPNVFKTVAPAYDPIDPTVPCPAANAGCFRLYGKAANSPGSVDRAGLNIYNPTYARTWAGSFALGAGSANPSSNSLFGASDALIGQALANSAAHEIAHLFGVGHSAPCFNGTSNLMCADLEQFESTIDKSFGAGDQAILLAFLGPAQNGGEVPEPATLTLVGLGMLGVVRTRSRRIARRAYSRQMS